jgi:ABC-type Mn2+/Zn2+ transport system ATPase subunit
VSAIEINNATLARGERAILSDVNVSIREGEFVGVFGPNGSGKSTLLQAILGLIHPTTGKFVYLSGGRREKTRPRAIYRKNAH